MSQRIGATGVGLPSPQALYPATIYNAPQLSGTNQLALPPGSSVTLPPGTFMVSPGQVSMLQVNDPVTQVYMPYMTYGVNGSFYVESDGVNYRVANLTGTPYSAAITSSGAGYTSAPTVAASVGGSTWTAILGGGVGSITANSGGSGANYTTQPIVNIASPPAPGVCAKATATLIGGKISAFNIIEPGAGYTSAPTVTIVPNPLDTATNITNATATAALSYNGSITAVLLTNPGTPLNTSPPALTFSGGGSTGSGAAASALMVWTISSYTVSTAGSGYSGSVLLESTGGTLTSGLAATNNASVTTNALIQRPANIQGTLSNAGVTTGGTIVDGGLFYAAPSLVAVPGPVTATSGAGNVAASISAVVSGINDVVFITPL